MSDSNRYYTISELAKELNISTRTIRYYEEIGLLKPVRDKNSYRSYTRSDRARIKLILRGKKFGFPLEEIREMIELFDMDRTGIKQLERTIEYGDKKIEEIDHKINELLELKQELTSLRDQFKNKLKDS